MITAVTTFHKEGLDLYGQRFLESFANNVDKRVKLIVYAENCEPVNPDQTQITIVPQTNLKQLVESDKIIIEDFDIINELSTYIVHGSSFQAEEGCNDDLVMCCVLFAWATDQTYFKELTDSDIRAQMYKDQQNQIEQDMAPFGFVVNGLEEENVGTAVDEYGTKWNPVVRKYDTNW